MMKQGGRFKRKLSGASALLGALLLLALARDTVPPGTVERFVSARPVQNGVTAEAVPIGLGQRIFYSPSECDDATGGACKGIDPVTRTTVPVLPNQVAKTPSVMMLPPPVTSGKSGEIESCIKFPVANPSSNESTPSPVNPPLSLPTDRGPASSSPSGPPPGPSQTGTNNGPITTLAYSVQAADNARGLDLVAAAKQRNEMIVQAARSDESRLATHYANMPAKVLQESFERAQGFLDDVVQKLSDGKSKLDPSEAARFKNLYLNARDKAALASSTLNEESQAQGGPGAGSPFAGLFKMGQGPEENPLSKTPGLGEIFGTDPFGKTPTSTDALVNRMVMLGGLPEQQRKKALKDLKLAESIPVNLPNGSQQTIPILHNGYLLGGGKSAIDCSSFVSQILPADIRKGNLTTLDLRNIWIYKKRGAVPNPPLYEKGRLDLIKKMSDGFVAIDLYHGDQLAVGDLLVYRLPWDPIGHVFLVKAYNPATMKAEVIEAAQSAGTVRERDFGLALDPSNPNDRSVRPGFLALRLNPVSNKCCGYKDSRQPAAKKAGTSKLSEGGRP